MRQYDLEQETLIFNIQHYSLHDGPGIRTIVFLKGCPMRCKWCCNPESQKYGREISYAATRCIGRSECGFCGRKCKNQAISYGEDGRAQVDFRKCGQCVSCAEVCPSKALKAEGKAYTVGEILDMVERDGVFYNHGDGGLTVSGGEPLSHGGFLIPLLREAKRRKIHTAIETCGNADYDVLSHAAAYLDHILYDIKTLDAGKHKQFTGCGNRRILENYERLCREYPLLPKRVRTPVIPGFNDTEEEIREIYQYVLDKGGASYEPLPYHSFGKGKYQALGRIYEMGDVKLSEKMREEIAKYTAPPVADFPAP